MLESGTFQINGQPVGFFAEVRTTENLPVALEFWMADTARRLLQLGAFFRAAAIMCQIPGAAQYRCLLYDDVDDNAPPEDEDPRKWVRSTDRDTVYNVLAECLRRLGAAGLMRQVPGCKDYVRQKLSRRWQAYLDRHTELKNGLLNVVAECLDELIVRPGMAEVDTAPAPTWWQRWWTPRE